MIKTELTCVVKILYLQVKHKVNKHENMMTLPRSSNSTASSTTPLPRTSSDVGMAEGAAAETPPPPLSACMPATSLNTIPGTHSATKAPTRWLPHILPIDALDASFGDNKTVMHGVLRVQWSNH